MVEFNLLRSLIYLLTYVTYFLLHRISLQFCHETQLTALVLAILIEVSTG